MTDHAHRALSILTRVLELSCLLVVVSWIAQLGGISLRPAWSDDTTNDTGRLFNLHPLLMTAAFAVLMAEALQAWRSPIIPGLERHEFGGTEQLQSPSVPPDPVPDLHALRMDGPCAASLEPFDV